MLLLDLNIRNKADIAEEKITTIPAVINCEHILEKTYIEYTRMFEAILENITICENMVLDVKLETKDLLDKEDVKQYHQNLVNAFCNLILTSDRRFKNDDDIIIPKVDNLAMGLVLLRKLSLYITKINCFNIRLRYKNLVMDMIEGYYECNSL